MRVWHLLVASIFFAFLRLVGMLIDITTCLLVEYSDDIRQVLQRWRCRANRKTGLLGVVVQALALGASGVFVLITTLGLVIAVVTVILLLIAFVPEFYQPD